MDHPRGCGEHLSAMSLMTMFWGSGHLGIIPADAGSTELDNPGAVDRGDHPRGCGEHLL